MVLVGNCVQGWLSQELSQRTGRSWCYCVNTVLTLNMSVSFSSESRPDSFIFVPNKAAMSKLEKHAAVDIRVLGKYN